MSKAYKIDFWRQPAAAREFLLEKCGGDKKLLRGVVQILYGTLHSDQHDMLHRFDQIEVHVPYYVWRTIGVKPEQLAALGILENGWQSYRSGESAGAKGQCRRFVLSYYFVLEYLRICINNMNDSVWCNVTNGSSTNQSVTAKVKGKGHPGRPRRTSIALLNWRKGVLQAEMLLRKAETITSRHHRARAIQAIRCLAAIRGNPTFHFKRDQPGFASYTPVYSQSDCGGRWYEIASGFQGLPQSIKSALLEGTKQQNYDLRSCHVAAAVALAGMVNSHTKFLGEGPRVIGLEASTRELSRGVFGARDLLKRSGCYEEVAHRAELPRSVVKSCILSILYGGSTSNRCVFNESGDIVQVGAVMSALLEHHGQGIDLARASHKRLLPYLKHLIAFARSLLNVMDSLADNPRWWRRQKKDFRKVIHLGYNGRLFNAVGTWIDISAFQSSRSSESAAARRRALSHVLTGIEQQAIQKLLEQCKTNGITVLHLEHDGIVTDMPIPRKVAKAALKDSPLANYTDLDLKPFKTEADDLDRIIGVLGEKRGIEDSDTADEGVDG